MLMCSKGFRVGSRSRAGTCLHVRASAFSPRSCIFEGASYQFFLHILTNFVLISGPRVCTLHRISRDRTKHGYIDILWACLFEIIYIYIYIYMYFVLNELF